MADPSRRVPLARAFVTSVLLTSALSALPGITPAAENDASDAISGLPLVPCVGDADGDRAVTVAEVVLAVRNLLHGCPVPTPTATRPPRPTNTPGPLELEILRTIGSELVPNPGLYGCSSNASPPGGDRFLMTCELPVGFASVSIHRYASPEQAALAFDNQRGDEELIAFERYDAFEIERPSLGQTPSVTLVWRADRWVLQSSQIAIIPDESLYVTIAIRLVEEGRQTGLFPE